MLDILFPEAMTTLQVIAVQNLVGRKHDYVRVFGFKENDPEHKAVEVALNASDAVDLIEHANREKSFPLIEVPSRCIISILTTYGIDVIHIGEVGEDPKGPGPHGRKNA
jgi:hypothetical protein